MTQLVSWFDVDKEGLAKLLEKRGKAFAILELLQNAWDADGVTNVVVTLVPIEGRPRVKVLVADDAPDGFRNLAHSFTLFAESEKKGQAEKRGRFNLGEKLVLAIMDDAKIASTRGTVVFDADGRHRLPEKTKAGSVFSGTLRMTRAECEETLMTLLTLLPPVKTSVNGEEIARRLPLHSFEATLPTEIADAEGNLRRTTRKTTVNVYEPAPDEIPSLYEMGIPVVETGDRWHIEIGQKVPLNMDRDNVPPAFLRDVRTLVVNELHAKLTEADANQTWVREATSDEDCAPAAVAKVMDLRFGPKRVAYDPSDPEANKLAVSKGYTVVTGSMMNATEWANAKKAGAIQPAGKVTPSPKTGYALGGQPEHIVPPEKYTDGMKAIIAFADRLAYVLLEHSIGVKVTNESSLPFGACFDGLSGTLTFNVGRLGWKWFEEEPFSEKVIRLLIHEFAHEASGDHLSSEYHDALSTLGAKLALAVRDGRIK